MNPFEEFINKIDKVDEVKKPIQPEIILPDYSQMPKPETEVEDYIQELIMSNALPYEKYSYRFMVEVYSEYIIPAEIETPIHFWKYCVIFLWNIYNNNTQKMNAMKLALMFGIALGRLITWKTNK